MAAVREAFDLETGEFREDGASFDAAELVLKIAPDGAGEYRIGLHMSVASASQPAVPVRDTSRAMSSTFGRRMIALAVFVMCAAVLGVAAWLTPSESGIGTHRVMNLPPCTWVAMADIPCPTCGMTTAFAHAADGNLVASFLAQPLGCVLAIATAMALLLGLHVALTGSLIGRALGGRLLGRRTGWAIAGAVLAAWGFKILSYKGLL
jgi:hypothetical protein